MTLFVDDFEPKYVIGTQPKNMVKLDWRKIGRMKKGV
jgi:hypothetical protein